MKKLLFSVLFAVFFLVVNSSIIHAATYCTTDSGNCYVDGTNGLDSNNGKTTGTAWKTIQHAAATVGAGDTVNVKGGITYSGTNTCGSSSATVCLTKSGTVGNYITFQPWPGTGSPIVSGPTFGMGIGLDTYGSGVNYNKINGFIIKNTNAFYGIAIGGTSDIVSNNIIYCETRPAYSVGIYGAIYESDTVYIYNNVIANQGWSGIHFDDGTAVMRNNIIVDSGRYGIDINSGAGTVYDVDFNDVYGSVTKDYALGLLQRGGHDLSVDPQFTDSANYNYTLKSTSPLIDAGTTLSTVPTDALGATRPQGNGYDMGAYESSYSNASPPNAVAHSDYVAPSNLMTQLAFYTGETTASQFGQLNSYSSILIGDTNEDGYADLMVGARHTDPVGTLYIFNGKKTPVDTSGANADVTIKGMAGSESVISDNVSLGDVDGDGHKEMLITDYHNNKAYLMRTGSTLASEDISHAAATFTGIHTFGGGSTILGDVNGDGYDDVIIDGAVDGIAYLFYGSSTLTDKSYTQADVTYTSGQISYFTRPGDINHDGYDDILIGCPDCGGHGMIYIFYGGPSLTSKDVSQADVILTGASGYLGGWNALADINGDGYVDILSVDGTKTYVFYGGPNLTSKSSDQADIILSSDPNYSESGRMGLAVEAADINNDSYSDVITSDRGLPRTYVFYGGPSLKSENATHADLVFDYIVYQKSPTFGSPITTGDVNGDGYTEIAAGNGYYNDLLGAVWLFTPPHGSPQISIGNTVLPVGSTSISGTITDSVAIGGVEASFDGGAWRSCSVSSSNFDCSLSGVSSGVGHSLRVRSKTSLGVYIPSSSYLTASFGILTTAGAPSTSCSATTPTGKAPWIYRATPKGNSVTLKFTNWQTPVDHFTLEYGTKSGNYRYAVDNIGGNGTNSYTVNSLNPNTIYYFRIRTGDGCAAGSWSNEIKAKTQSLKIKSQNLISNLKTKITNMIKQILPGPTSKPSSTPIPQPTSSSTPKKKFCFLWWCW